MCNKRNYISWLLKQSKMKILLFTLIFSSSFLFAQHTPYWNHKASMFSILPNEPNEIIFLGDSITDRCEWFELFSNPNVKNRGLSADKTAGVLDRLSEVTESNPAKVFIMIGINDIRHDVNVTTIVGNYYKIIEKIKADSPDTEIYLQSVLPINTGLGEEYATNNEVNSLNNYIKSMAGSFSATYLDINSKLKDTSGQLDAQYSEDGLHINGAGYLVWKTVVEEYVNE